MAPCTARFANQPQHAAHAEHRQGCNDGAIQSRHSPHTRKCVAFAKTILWARRRQALDRDGPRAAAMAPARPIALGPETCLAQVPPLAGIATPDARALGRRARPASAIVAPFGVQQGKPQQQGLQVGGSRSDRRQNSSRSRLPRRRVVSLPGCMAWVPLVVTPERAATHPRSRTYANSFSRDQIVNGRLSDAGMRRRPSAVRPRPQSARRPKNSRHFSSSSRLKNSLAVWACAMLPGPQTMAGAPPSWKRPASVQ